MFHVGQKVRCTVGGDGIVEETSAGVIYPVKVRFTSGIVELYTEAGERWGRPDAILSPVEDNASPQDFLSELKALLEKYDVRVQAGLYEHGQLELQIWSGGERVKTIDGWMFYSGDF